MINPIRCFANGGKHNLDRLLKQRRDFGVIRIARVSRFQCVRSAVDNGLHQRAISFHSLIYLLVLARLRLPGWFRSPRTSNSRLSVCFLQEPGIPKLPKIVVKRRGNPRLFVSVGIQPYNHDIRRVVIGNDVGAL